MRVFIFHGTLGSPEGNWFPWLKSVLEEKNWDVFVPRLPTPDQSQKKWEMALLEQIIKPRETDIIIAHSSGATFALRLLEKEWLYHPKKVILVSGLIDKIGNAEYDILNAPFIDKPFDWKTIKKCCSKRVTVLHGDNDPYVPIEQAEEVAKNLEVPLQIIKNGGHLNAESGYTEFSEILDFIYD